MRWKECGKEEQTELETEPRSSRKEADTIKTDDGARLRLLNCRTWVKREGQWQLVIWGEQQEGCSREQGVRFGLGIRTLLDTLRIIT